MSLAGDIDEFVALNLPSDPDAWCKRFQKPKIIHDALWGTFSLKPHEVALLDVPLLQRLRYVKQTGAVYATYPSALHTRFEHTLGVLLQAGKVCTALRNDPKEQRMDPNTEHNVRVGAMLHDTGHGPFSHTSEQFFSSLPDIAEIKSSEERFKDSGAGEILSAHIVESAPMRKFLKGLNAVHKTNLDADLISRLITGATDDDHMYMSEIIHGPFDADKLDYMPRDGMFSGLKMHVDLDRLFHSISIDTATVDGQTMTRLSGAVSGISPLMQIMFNKMLLFTGIYHHHKVRAVDCMLWAIFQTAVETGAKVGGRVLKNSTDFLFVTDDRALIPELTDSSDVQQIIQAIRQRRLLKRALTISRRTVPESMHNQASASEKGLFPQFSQLSGNSKAKIIRRRHLSDLIWDAAGKPCKRLEVWLDVPSRPSMDEARRMWIKAPGTGETQTLGEFIPITEWVELYGMHQWRAHVFAPEDHTEKVANAAAEVLKGEFGLELLKTAFAA